MISMILKHMCVYNLSSLKEFKGESETLDDKSEFTAVNENESGEIVEKCVAKKRNVLDLYHIGKALSLARIERKWEADFERDHKEG